MANNFEYYSPTRVVFGRGTEQQAGKLIKEYGGKIRSISISSPCHFHFVL